MKTELYLVRHGETEWNIFNRFQGITNIDLTDKGREQAKFLNKRLENKFDCIYSSPLNRALETAEIICQGSDKRPIIHENLRELNFGIWEGLTIDEIKERYPSELQLWRTEGRLIDGELTIQNACNRILETIHEIVSTNLGKKVVITAHGGIIKTALIGLFHWNINMYHSIYLDNTSITKLIFTPQGKIIFSTLNDTRHLPLE